MSRLFFHPLILLVVALVVLSGCNFLPGSRSQTVPQSLAGPTPTPVPTPIVPTKPVYEVQRGTIVRTVEFLGRVAPVLERELFFKVDGRVRTIFVERDQFVTQGQLLADLEIAGLERTLASARLDLEQAEQELAQAERQRKDNLARAKLNLELALANLTKAAQEQADDLAEARIELAIKELELSKTEAQSPAPREVIAAARLAQAGVGLRQAQMDYNEIAYADDIGASPEAEALQQATLAYDQARAEYELALQAIETHDYDLTLLTQELAGAELDVQRLEEASRQNQPELRVALAQLEVDILERGPDPLLENNVARARLAVQNLEAEIAEAQIVAPFAGQIRAINLIEGRQVEPFKSVIVLADPSELEVSATPQDSQLVELAEGMPVTAEFSSSPGDLIPGFIRQLPYPYGGGENAEVLDDEDETTRITLETSLAEAGLELGDLMQLKVVLEEKENVLWLPPQAIRTFDARTFAVVQDGEAQRRVDVKIGIKSEDRVEIEEGLTAGQLVIGP